MDVSENLDSLWFFHNVLATKTRQITSVTDEAIKEAEKSCQLTDQIFQNQQEESVETVQQPNSCKTEVGISAEIKPEIVQQPKSSKIGVNFDAEFEAEPVREMEFKTMAATEKSTAWTRTTRRRRRRSRRKTKEVDSFSRESLVSPRFPEYLYWNRNGGNQWPNTHFMTLAYAADCKVK